MRVVLDTNVLARAVPGRNSPARQLLERLLNPTHVLVSSPILLDELARVLRYDRVRAIHGLDDPAIDAYVESIRTASLLVPMTSPPKVAGDPDDDFVIATAVDGQADVLCTWDRHLHVDAVTQYLAPLGVRVVRDVDLLQELQPQTP